MVDIAVSIEKADDEEHNLFGWAYVAAHADGTLVTDSHDEQIAPAELEKAAYHFVVKNRVSGEDHDAALGVTGVLIESMMFTKQKSAALAVDPFTGEINEPLAKALAEHMVEGLWVGFHIPDDDAWQRVKDGRGEFSIEGTARRSSGA